MNRVVLIGNLAKDPELTTTNNGVSVCRFSVACQRRFTNQNGEREADFINVVAWDKTGENVGKFMSKGRLIAVEGRIQTRNYDNNEGRKVYVTEVIASNVQFLESRNASAPAGNNGFSSMPEPPAERTPYDFAEEAPSSQPQPTMNIEDEKDPFAAFGESVEISDNDLPF